jgi:predicted enzyme related to lactoylglutathione lyase
MHDRTTLSPPILRAVAGVIVSSDQPHGLAGFYRDVLGIDLEGTDHGPAAHYHGMIGKTFVAILPRSIGGDQAVTPSFAVHDVDAAVAALTARGAELALPPIDIGDGKRVAIVRDPDGNALRLVELGA